MFFELITLVSLNYTPVTCNITDYYFTFLHDGDRFKVHGLWPEHCNECYKCGYPSCCKNITFTEPEDPSNFINNNWYNTTTLEECYLHKYVSLFEHEYYKHCSCMNINSTTEFLNLIIMLFKKYYSYNVFDKCKGFHELWLSLDSNFEYKVTICK